jgi:3-deoxy-manno-octulosonate cytidylyltransferase (CMP-KDO synthetase)
MTHPPRRIVGVIPARYGSTRFPGKVLALWRGKTILEHVHGRSSAGGLDDLWIAVDDERVLECARAFGAKVKMTSPSHTSGTDRVGELARSLDPAPHGVINIQGDEPLVDPKAISLLADTLRSDPDVRMVTLAHEIHGDEQAARPSVVKVVTDLEGNALYFSRSPVPFLGEGPGRAPCLRHIGLYGFRREALEAFVAHPPTPLERAEKLEQLRALEMGWKVRVLAGPWSSPAVDTPEDLEALERLKPETQ